MFKLVIEKYVASIGHLFKPVMFVILWRFSSALCFNPPEQIPGGTNMTDITKNAMELLNQNKLDSVLVISKSIIKSDPESPIGYFLAYDTYLTMMRDYRINNYEAEFDSLIKIALDKATVKLEKEPTAENHFILGTVKGNYCLHLFQGGNFIKAIKTAGSSVSLFKKASKIDPEFVDPLLGIALYDYAKSKFLFGILGGNKEQVIAKLRRVEAKGQYVSTNAKYSLQAIYFASEQYDAALAINDQLYQQYPENPSCVYNRALLIEKVNRLTEAIDLWEKLLISLKKSKYISNGYLAECNYHLAWIHHQLKDETKARGFLHLAVKYAAQRNAAAELEGPHVKFNDIKKQINALAVELKQK